MTAPDAPAPRPLPLRLLLSAVRGLVTLAAALLLVEVGLRLTGIGVPPRGPNNALPLRLAVPADRAPRLHEGLRPGASGSVLYPGFGDVPDRTVDYAINRDGFRDDDLYAVPKPDDVFRVACLGDSVTYGTGVQVEDTFAERLEARLAAAGLERRVEVMNCGVYAHNTSQQVAWFELAVRRFEPDLVLVTSTVPDASGKNVERGERPPTAAARWIARLGLTSGLWGVGEATGNPRVERTMALRRASRLVDLLAHELYSALISRAERSNYTLDWLPDAPGRAMVEQALTRLAQGARLDGFELRVAMFPTLEHLDGDYPYSAPTEALAAICADLDLPFLDLFAAFEGRDAVGLRAHPHDHHPNARAHAIAAEALAEWLTPAIAAAD